MQPTKDEPGLIGAYPGACCSESLDDARIVAALEQYEVELAHARSPDRAAVLAAYPEIAVELSACIDALELVFHSGAMLRRTK